MKKIFTLLAALLIGGAAASADDVVFIGDTGYPSLYDAVDAATEGATITIKGDIMISGNRKDITKTLTIEAEEVDGKMPTITCRKRNNLIFLIKAPVTFKNWCMVYNDNASNNGLFEVNQGGTLTMEDCSISNFKRDNTNNNRIIEIKDKGGDVILKNVTFTNSLLPDNFGEIRLNNNKLTLAGCSNGSVFVQTGKKIKVDATFAPSIPVQLYVEGGTAGNVVVEGTEDLSKFNMMSTNFSLVAKDGNIVLADYAVPTGSVVLGQKVYSTLDAAVNDSKNGNVINVNGDVSAGSMFWINNNITIQGKEGDMRVKVSTKENDGFAYVKNTASLRNLDIVYTGDKLGKVLIESSNSGNLTLENCEISNFVGSNNQGVICAKASGKVNLNNVIFVDCIVPENCGEIFLGSGGSTINGTTNGSILVEGISFAVGENFDPAPKTQANAIDVENVPAANAVKLYIAKHTEGNTVVEGTEDASKFNLIHDTLALAAKDGNLVLQKKTGTGIAGVEADENAPVVYFNLNGVQVKADNMTPGVYVRRQGKNVTKVMVK